MQQKKGPGLAFAMLQSIASVTLGFSIAKFGSIAPFKEGIFILVAIVFLTLALGVFYKYKLGSNINPAITNPKVKNFLARYPLFPALMGMAVGVFIMVVALRILGNE